MIRSVQIFLLLLLGHTSVETGAFLFWYARCHRDRLPVVGRSCVPVDPTGAHSGSRAILFSLSRAHGWLSVCIFVSVPIWDGGSTHRLRLKLEQTLANPDGNPVTLELAKPYLKSFFYDVRDEDLALVAQIVADERVREIEDALETVFHERRVPAEMRLAYAKRILMENSGESLRNRLANGLANMPPGTFANPNASDWMIWRSPTSYPGAGAFLASLSDLESPQALPALRSAFEEALTIEPYFDRRRVLDGIREGLIRIGPVAGELSPRIRQVFLQRPSPIMRTAGDADQWRFALARIGVAIDDLPFFPSQPASSIARMKRRTADQLSRYNDRKH
ncbi:MAG: hypothetical protein AAGD07_05280 [Planctomycetota bacterium]